ncbi:hypothetical protein LCGC14_0745370 [marine sediment metagenome]|uniref:Uncharacterized protein n=1 Tax=marine sediment metagenome TaxID=412755 RepID=A0A0F9Q9S2_9ZZZZ
MKDYYTQVSGWVAEANGHQVEIVVFGPLPKPLSSRGFIGSVPAGGYCVVTDQGRAYLFCGGGPLAAYYVQEKLKLPEDEDVADAVTRKLAYAMGREPVLYEKLPPWKVRAG